MPTLQTILRRVTFTQALIVAAVIRLVVVAYIEYHDSHSILKFTDIDYRVFGDATKLILKPDLPKGRLSEGKLAKALGMNFGDPYARDTYRYTPLLALTLLPNEWIHPIWGKLLFSASDLVVGAVLYKIFMMTKGPRQADCKSSPRMAEVAKTEQEAIKWVGGLWLFNPMVIGISARGNAESILGLIVISCLGFVMDGRLDAAAVVLGLAVHFKIYPFIYATSILSLLAARGPGVFGVPFLSWTQVRFGLISLSTFFVFGATMYGFWGWPFLENTYLYHLHRRDHRHNFSPYFYPIYLTYPSAGSKSEENGFLSSPLVSFLPQMIASLGSGFLLGWHMEDTPLAWFTQTVLFVNFNKVCTSQYFMWYMWFLPLVLPNLSISKSRSAILLGSWIIGQAIWLSIAYRLELLGFNVYLPLWGASILFSLINYFILGQILQSYATYKQRIQKQD